MYIIITNNKHLYVIIDRNISECIVDFQFPNDDYLYIKRQISIVSLTDAVKRMLFSVDFILLNANTINV